MSQLQDIKIKYDGVKKDNVGNIVLTRSLHLNSMTQEERAGLYNALRLSILTKGNLSKFRITYGKDGATDDVFLVDRIKRETVNDNVVVSLISDSAPYFYYLTMEGYIVEAAQTPNKYAVEYTDQMIGQMSGAKTLDLETATQEQLVTLYNDIASGKFLEYSMSFKDSQNIIYKVIGMEEDSREGETTYYLVNDAAPLFLILESDGTITRYDFTPNYYAIQYVDDKIGEIDSILDNIIG